MAIWYEVGIIDDGVLRFVRHSTVGGATVNIAWTSLTGAKSEAAQWKRYSYKAEIYECSIGTAGVNREKVA